MSLPDFNFPVSIIGAGCICSNLTPFLVRMGIRDIRVFDPDIVEEHNLHNQLYRPQDIGQYKVKALTDIIQETTGVVLKGETCWIDQKYFDMVVICGVDSMASRRAIWEKSIKFQPQIPLYLEARVGGSALKVYAINPIDLGSVRLYEENLHDDSTVLQPDCARGEIPALTAVVSVLTGLIYGYAEGKILPSEVILDTRHWTTLTQ